MQFVQVARDAEAGGRGRTYVEAVVKLSDELPVDHRLAQVYRFGAGPGCLTAPSIPRDPFNSPLMHGPTASDAVVRALETQPNYPIVSLNRASTVSIGRHAQTETGP